MFAMKAEGKKGKERENAYSAKLCNNVLQIEETGQDPETTYAGLP